MSQSLNFPEPSFARILTQRLSRGCLNMVGTFGDLARSPASAASARMYMYVCVCVCMYMIMQDLGTKYSRAPCVIPRWPRAKQCQFLVYPLSRVHGITRHGMAWFATT